MIYSQSGAAVQIINRVEGLPGEPEMVNVRYSDGKEAVRQLWSLKATNGAREIADRMQAIDRKKTT